MMRKIFKILGYTILAIVVFLIVIAVVYFPSMKKVYSGYKVVPHDSSMFFVLGGGGNSVILKTDSVVMVVDTKVGKAAQKLHDEVMTLAENKEVIVVNTHSDRDHTGGNPLYQGTRVITGKLDEDYWRRASGDERLPDVWVADTYKIYLGSDSISIISMGQSHTWNDAVVVFHNRGVLVTGDLLFNRMNVALADGKGSNGRNYHQALLKLKQIQGVKIVVPGHGETGGPELLDLMLAYFDDMSLVADDLSKEKEIRKKYKKWLSMPGMTPEAVIENLRKNKPTE